MLYRPKAPASRRKRIGIALLSLLVTVAVCGACRMVCTRVGSDLAEQRSESIKAAVLGKARQCYAIEGAYPTTLAYLESNYGLLINHDDYIVTYEVFGSNVSPEVQVLPISG
ncbi:MAG: hypothetical protein HGA54_06955 [Actinobacteria bacterium]|nr:hypothetical protein [Actinomycetota bacterium]